MRAPPSRNQVTIPQIFMPKVFFAMILADAGYGFVIGLAVAYYWKHLGQSQSGRRSRNVLATLVVSSVGYGVLCGSYFGCSPSAESFLGRLRIADSEISNCSAAVLVDCVVL